MAIKRIGVNITIENDLSDYFEAFRLALKRPMTHEVSNLFVTDGSFMPTGGSVTYTWTIYANSFRVGDYIVNNKKEILNETL